MTWAVVCLTITPAYRIRLSTTREVTRTRCIVRFIHAARSTTTTFVQPTRIWFYRKGKTRKEKKREIWQYILILALIRTLDGTVIFVVNFLIACFVPEILKDKKGQKQHYSSAILDIQKNSSRQNKMIFFS